MKIGLFLRVLSIYLFDDQALAALKPLIVSDQIIKEPVPGESVADLLELIGISLLTWA
jgi:hypothetical protein